MWHSKHSFNIDAKNRQGLLLKIAWLSSLLSWHAVKALANEIAYYETCVHFCPYMYILCIFLQRTEPVTCFYLCGNKFLIGDFCIQ